MKHLFIIFFITITFYSCSRQDPKNYIQYIDGYWEIERVVLSDGTEKTYNFNETIDFFTINDSIGVRKKVRPKLDGNFIATKDSKKFILKVENDSLRMYYKTDLDSWKETVLLAKENQIIIKNETGNTYFYKPYQKLKL